MDELDVLVTSNTGDGIGSATRITTAEEIDRDYEIENVLRPKSMEGYVGQERVKDNLWYFWFWRDVFTFIERRIRRGSSNRGLP